MSVQDRLIVIDPDVQTFICPRCLKGVSPQSTLDAIRQGIWGCGDVTWRIVHRYDIEELALS